MTAQVKDENGSKGWVGYRDEIRVVDCSIRDGGLMNKHYFCDDVVRTVYDACVAAGVDVMEIGYKTSQRISARDAFGDWKFCHEDDVRRIVGENATALKLCAMADAERTDYHEDILPADKSVLDMIRVATYIHQIPTALDMVKDAHDKGYETTVNLMAVSCVAERDLDQALELLGASEVEAVYIVDSFGSLYSEQIRALVEKYISYVGQSGKCVGIHAHNNLQLAFANTIEAVIGGAKMLDATLGGVGRGAGNCQMELLLAFLHNPKFKVRPIFKCVQQVIEPMRKDMKWGYSLPYLVTGMLNQHPGPAIQFNEAAEEGDIIEFLDSISATE